MEERAEGQGTRKGASVPKEQEEAVLSHAKQILWEKPELTQCIACVEALGKHFKSHPVTTAMEFEMTVKHFMNLFMKEFDERSVESCLAQYLQRGQNAIGNEENEPESFKPLFGSVADAVNRATSAYLKEISDARAQISRYGVPLITGATRVLLHGKSRTALALLVGARNQGQQILVFLTPGALMDTSASDVRATLTRMGIPCVLVPDCSMMAAVRAVDLVLLGAVLVDEAGGILNRTGGAQIALIAHSFHKQVIVAAETFKFSRMFVLGPASTPYKQQRTSQVVLPPGIGNTMVFGDPRDVENIIDELAQTNDDVMPVLLSEYDYTPPQDIDLIVTNVGVLSPSCVSGELIKLYGY